MNKLAMKPTLTLAQFTAVQSAMRAEFEAWKAERLEARANHVTSLIDDNRGSIDFIRLRQNAIRSIDLEIKQRHEFLDALFRAINLNVKMTVKSS